MGILTTFKHIIPFFLYGVSFVLIIKALSGKTEWLLMLTIVLLPLRNVIDRLHAFPLGKDLTDIIFIVLLFGILVRGVTSKNRIFEKTSLNSIIFVMILYMFISLLIGANYLNSYTFFDPSDMRVQSWKNFCLLPVLFLVTLNTITDKKWVWRTVLVMCFTMVLMNMYLVRQIIWYSNIESRVKIHGTFVYLGPNEVAAFYNQYTILLMGLYFFIKKRIIKIALLGLIVINLFCILFLFSRAAYLGLIVGMFFLFLIKNKMLLIPLLLAVVYWQVALPQRVQDRILETTDAYGELDKSSELRLIVWQNAVDLFAENPIFGVGYAVFSQLGYALGDVHNIYLKILAEQGLIGFVIFLILLFILFIQGIKLFLGGDDDPSKGLGLGFAICVIVLMVNNMFGDRWTYLQLSSYLWVFAGLVVRLNILSNQSPERLQAEKSKTGIVLELNEKYKK